MSWACPDCNDARWRKGAMRCMRCGAGWLLPLRRPTEDVGVLRKLLMRWMAETQNDWTTDKRLQLLADTRRAMGRK